MVLSEFRHVLNIVFLINKNDHIQLSPRKNTKIIAVRVRFLKNHKNYKSLKSNRILKNIKNSVTVSITVFQVKQNYIFLLV